MEKSSKKSLYRKSFRSKAINIGARHRDIRKDLGLTIVQLAKKFKIGKTTISNCERGIQEFPFSYIVEFAKEFEINIQYLIEGKKWPKYIPEAVKPQGLKISDLQKNEYNTEAGKKLDEVLNALQEDEELLETVWHWVKAKEGIKKFQSRK